MHCQRETAQTVVDGGGDYVLAVKGNQHTLRDDVVAFCKPITEDASWVDVDIQVDAGHGRIETRKAWVTDRVDWIQKAHGWPGLRALAKVEALRTTGDGTT